MPPIPPMPGPIPSFLIFSIITRYTSGSCIRLKCIKALLKSSSSTPNFSYMSSDNLAYSTIISIITSSCLICP